MKKEQAEQLECPFIYTGDMYGPNITTDVNPIYCKTTKCMAWMPVGFNDFVDEGEDQRENPESQHGYCIRLGK